MFGIQKVSGIQMVCIHILTVSEYRAGVHYSDDASTLQLTAHTR